MGLSLFQIGVLIAILTSLLLNVVLGLRFVWTRSSRTRTVAVRIAVSGFAALYALLALELGFFAFVDSSDSFGFTLASKRWFARYWHPINSLGIRDEDHDPIRLREKRVVIAAGDSFVAGHGIRDPRDRFANKLAERLGDDWEVVVLAKSGWHTVDQYEALVQYPVQPEVIVLSYYFNDVEHAFASHGLELPAPFDPPPGFLRPLVERSHFLNFVYWRFYRFANGAEIDRQFWEFFQHNGQRADVWATHAAALRKIAHHAKEHGSRLIVVVFPQLREIERSKPYTSRVTKLFEDEGVEVLDLSPRLAGRDPDELIVGPLDNHPSVELNREVAEILFELIDKP